MVENRYTMIPFFVSGGKKLLKPKSYTCAYNYNTYKIMTYFWVEEDGITFAFCFIKLVYQFNAKKKSTCFLTSKSIKIPEVTLFCVSFHFRYIMVNYCRIKYKKLLTCFCSVSLLFVFTQSFHDILNSPKFFLNLCTLNSCWFSLLVKTDHKQEKKVTTVKFHQLYI